MVHLQSKLKDLKIEMPIGGLEFFTLLNLPKSRLLMSGSWSVNDLITKCIVEEEELKKENSLPS